MLRQSNPRPGGIARVKLVSEYASAVHDEYEAGGQTS